MTRLTAVSLFAGVGGIDLALERAGVKVVAAVEIDNAARGVLADRFPNTTLFPDVTKVTADDLRAAGFIPERGIVCAGWPCQGNSVAGRRQGLADPRSGLWSHVVRLLDVLRPRWFLGENVPGLLSVTDGEDFGRVLQDVADLGMGFAYRVLDAQHFGVPQRRRRVFIVGHLGDARRPVEVLLEPEGSEGDSAAGVAARPGVAGAAGERVELIGEAAPCLTASYGEQTQQDFDAFASANAMPVEVVSTLQAHGGDRGYRIDAEAAAGGHLIPATFQKVIRSGARDEDGSLPQDDVNLVAFQPQAGGDSALSIDKTAPTLSRGQVAGIAETVRTHPRPGSNSNGAMVATETTVRRLTPLECERLQGFPDNWTATSNGKPQADSPRYKQMGNAVAVPCVEWVARRIVRADA